jgi:hypothetical protein
MSAMEFLNAPAKLTNQHAEIEVPTFESQLQYAREILLSCSDKSNIDFAVGERI